MFLARRSHSELTLCTLQADGDELGSDGQWRPTRLLAEASSFSSHLTSMARTSAAILTEVSPLRFVTGALECGGASDTVR
jgi:hypothetical protein